jgi:hypothetical protein
MADAILSGYTVDRLGEEDMRWFVLAFGWAACTPEGKPPVDPTPSSDTDGTVDTDSPPTGPTDPTDPTDPPTGETGSSGTDPWDQPVDCAALLPVPAEHVKYTWAPSAEDFTFSADGYMISVSGGLKRTPFGGPAELLVPLPWSGRGTRFLPDGRLVVAAVETGDLMLLDPDTGAQQVLAGGLSNPNGVAVGIDGKVYVATSGQILQVDPDTAAIEVIADLPGNSFDGIVFSPDFRRLYFNEELGQVHYLDFDDDGNPGTSQVGAQIPVSIGFGILDGMSVDACGNLYVIEMNGVVWRVRADDGLVEEVVRLSGINFIPAMNFGYPEVGGWDHDALYVLDFAGAVYEVQIGVPGKWEPHMPVP